MGRNNLGENIIAALLIVGVVLFMGFLVSITEPKCSKYGCDNTCEDGSSYCYLHESGRWWKYSSGGSLSGSSGNSSGSSSSSSSSSYSGASSGSSSSSSSSNKSSSSSSSENYSSSGSRWDAYDEGYEDVMDYEDYDYDRYESDSEYANGVDDAIDEYYDEYGEEW